MIGLVLALIVVAIVLFVLFLVGWGRRTARTPDTPA